MPHAHGYLKVEGVITQRQFQSAASKAGLGKCEIKRVPYERSRLAMHFAYPFKSLDDPEIRDGFIEWNGRGEHIGLASWSRGFFKQADRSDRVDNALDSDGTAEPSPDEGAKPSVASQEPVEQPPGLAVRPRFMQTVQRLTERARKYFLGCSVRVVYEPSDDAIPWLARVAPP